MIEENKMQVYSEVYGILNSLGRTYINSIPKKLYDLIDEKRDKTFNPIYDVSAPLSEQKISKKATEFICMLHYNYWSTSEEKNKINKVLKYNTEQARNMYFKYEEKLNKNNAGTDADKSNEKDFDIDNDNTAIAVKNNISWLKKILNFFKNIFK